MTGDDRSAECESAGLARVVPVLLALAVLPPATAASRSRPAEWPSPADADVVREQTLVQVTRTMSLDLPAQADAAFPLFGPVRESEWSPDWAPVFIAPLPGAQSPDGAVFTTGGKETPSVWVMTDYNPARRVVRYVNVRPGRLVTQIWIAVSPASPGASRAHVTYRCTLLGPEGREALAHLTGAFPGFKEHWEEAIAAALARRRTDSESRP
jgi:hypothetical protein